MPYDKDKACNILKNEFGWEYYGGKHHESVYTKFIQTYWLPKKFNIDYRKATFSTLICAGDLSRENALELLKTKPWDEKYIEEDIEFIAKKLNISASELIKFINNEPKRYWNYPNAKRSLEFGYSIYRMINKK